MCLHSTHSLSPSSHAGFPCVHKHTAQHCRDSAYASAACIVTAEAFRAGHPDYEALTDSVHSCPTDIPAIPPSVVTGGPAAMLEFAVQSGGRAAAAAAAPLAASLGSSAGGAALLFPLLTVVRSSGLLGSLLPQALFAACVLADIIGRVAARRVIPSVSTLKVWSPTKP